MRLDLLLKQSGLIKRRIIAKEFCDRGLVSVNGKKCKPSHEVKDGDFLEIIYGEKTILLNIQIEMQGKKKIIHLLPREIKDEGEIDA